MTDTIINGSGNSRTLKTVPNIKALVSDLDDLLDLLIDGFPVDLLGPNPEGCQVIGDNLNKATLLTDDTAALYGLTAEAVPNEVLAKIAPPLALIPNKANIGYGSYTGSSGQKTLTFTFAPRLVIVHGREISGQYGYSEILFINRNMSTGFLITANKALSSDIRGLTVTQVSFGYNDVSFTNTNMNQSDHTYGYIAIG